MDGMLSHFSEELDNFCMSHGIIIIQPPPHSSDQVQALDLCIFAAIKSYAPRIKLMSTMNNQTIIIEKVFKSIQMESTTHDIMKSFKRAGIISRWDEKKCLRAIVDL